MILYADASALLKLYLEENESAVAMRLIGTADAVVTSAIAYVEIRASLSRALNSGRLSHASYMTAVAAFEERWTNVSVVEIDESLIKRAANAAETRRLKSLDAIHLASALRTGEDVGPSFHFLAFDADLLGAADAEGLALAL